MDRSKDEDRLTPPVLAESSLEVENRVAVLTLQRNDVRNALTGTALVDDIVRAVAWANGWVAPTGLTTQLQFSNAGAAPT